MIAYINAFKKYKFLISQLVSRDFRIKYKRSVLGVLWSLLNPLLTILVQYIVFSELFRFDIKNFPVYLLSGTVLFNFFSEATSQALISITGNASLITKVYVPKYIFPLTKVLSSCINLGFTLAALIIIVPLQGLQYNIYYLFIPFGLLCIIIFSMGISLILSSMMVYFRDTQFLYNVILTLWTYLTPLFYPESIVPEKFVFFIRINPMYYFIRYIRSIILDGILPDLSSHAVCILFSVITFMIGIFVFKKAQKNFILNI